MPEWKYQSVDLSVDASQTLESVPCLVRGAIVVSDMSAHDAVLTDDSASVLALDASSTTGDKIEVEDGLRFETDLKVVGHASATGTITVIYRILQEIDA